MKLICAALLSCKNLLAKKYISNTIKLCERGICSYTPRRACLYVPGNDSKKISKVLTMDIDCVILDCEDGVALNRKTVARETIKKSLETLSFNKIDVAVRINSDSSGLMEEDISVIMSSRVKPSTIIVPKVNYPHELDKFAEYLKKPGGKYRVVVSVESAMSVLNLRDILSHALRQPLSCPYIVDSVMFGSDDFCADIGVSRSREGAEVFFARQQVLLTSKAFHIQAIDMVDIDYKDIKGFEKSCEESSRLGYSGRQVIHPAQVPVAQRTYSPTTDRVRWAYELVEAFGIHQKSGEGAFAHQDKMIDMPTVLQAKNIIKMHDNISCKESSA